MNTAKGSPPLARGKQPLVWRLKKRGRITPACAGKTVKPDWFGKDIRDHPRLRGENINVTFQKLNDQGSPPLARGKLPLITLYFPVARITPACAGKTGTLTR